MQYEPIIPEKLAKSGRRVESSLLPAATRYVGSQIIIVYDTDFKRHVVTINNALSKFLMDSAKVSNNYDVVISE